MAGPRSGADVVDWLAGWQNFWLKNHRVWGSVVGHQDRLRHNWQHIIRRRYFDTSLVVPAGEGRRRPRATLSDQPGELLARGLRAAERSEPGIMFIDMTQRWLRLVRV